MKKMFVKVLSFMMVLAMLTSMAATFAFAADVACPGFGHTHTEAHKAIATATETVDAVCDVYGYTVYQCNECNDYFMADFVAPTNDAHELVSYDEVPAQCGVPGMKAYEQCEKCGDYFAEGNRYTTDAELVIPALEHDYELISSTGDCEKDGIATYKCSHCGDTYTEPVAGTGDGHDWVLVSVDVLPSVDAEGNPVDGEATYKCACGETAKFPVICAHDSKITLEAVAPNCTETGLTEGKKCSVCGYIEVAQVEIPAVGHGGATAADFEVLAAVAPTCTSKGLTEGKKCLICGEITVPQIELDEAPCEGKALVAFGGVVGNCTTKEVIAGEKCEVCGHVWVAPEEKDYVHDNVVEQITPATCIEYGVKATVCKTCGAGLDAVLLNPTGHVTYEDAIAEGYVINTTAASCTVDGKYTWTCHCGVAQEKVIPMTGHDLETISPVATCVRYAYTFTFCKNDNCTDANGNVVVAVDKVVVGGVEYKVYDMNGNAVKVIGDVVVDAAGGYNPDEHGENLVVPKVWNEPDCTHNGSHSEYCSACPYTKDVVEDPALGHTYDRTEPTWVGTPVVTPPTCTDQGYTTYTCVDCGATADKDFVPALGHTEEALAAVAPTCDATGLTAGVKCSVCNAILTAQNVVPALGHDFTVFVETVLPKCTPADGYDVYQCSRCDVTTRKNSVPYDWNAIATKQYSSVDEANKIHNVDPATEVELRAMNCATNVPGLYEYTCADCGKQIMVVIAVEHAWGAEQVRVEPTCTTTGMTAGKECTVCGAKEGLEEIPALGHTEEAIPAVDATCTTVGFTAGVKCSVCDAILTAPTEIPATGHDWATEHTYDRNNHWFECLNGCGEVNELTAHTLVPDVNRKNYLKEATCTDDGYVWEICECGRTQRQNIPALGHNFVETDVTSVLGCETDQYVEWQCTNCKDIQLKNYLPAIGHDVETLERVEPDCDDTGLTLGYQCKNGCDSTDPTVNLPQEVIPATGRHFNAAGEELIDSCTNKNVTDRVCVGCNDLNNNVIGITCAGDREASRVVAPTCVDEGYTIIFCADCFAIKSVVAPTAPDTVNGHAWGEWVETTAPTCTTEGVETATCELCGETKTQAVAALGHTEAYAFDDADTTHWVVCTVCDAVLSDAAPHAWDEGVVTTPAKPGVDGVRTHTCSVCGDTKEEDEPFAGLRVSFDYTSGVVAESNVVNGGLVAIKVYLEGTKENLDNITIKFNYDAARLTWVETKFGGDLAFDTSIASVKDGLATILFAGAATSGDADDMTEIDGTKLVATIIFRVDDYADVLEAPIPVNGVSTFLNGFAAEYVEMVEVTEDNPDGTKKYAVTDIPSDLEIAITKLGAISSDAVVDGQDLIALKKLIAEGVYQAHADINRDGQVNAIDYMVLAQYLGGVYTYEEFTAIGA